MFEWCFYHVVNLIPFEIESWYCIHEYVGKESVIVRRNMWHLLVVRCVVLCCDEYGVWVFIVLLFFFWVFIICAWMFLWVRGFHSPFGKGREAQGERHSWAWKCFLEPWSMGSIVCHNQSYLAGGDKGSVVWRGSFVEYGFPRRLQLMVVSLEDDLWRPRKGMKFVDLP